jgi:hypothetical protein
MLKESIETTIDTRDQAFKERLEAIHEAISTQGTENPFDYDFSTETFH